MEDIVCLNEAKPKEEKSKKHIPSHIQADTLFTFCPKLEYIVEPIKTKTVSARYCEENIKYLNIKGIKRISFPMKCFCDINMHKLEEHLSWYGYYGLAFKKEWGMRNKIQPIQYINPNSEICKDFSKAFTEALKINRKNQTKEEKTMKNYLLHQLMYLKPYSGRILNRNTERKKSKCFTDECEWRYVPSVSNLGYKQIYYNEKILNAGNLSDISDSMKGNPEISLNFDYDDLKYIIIKSEKDLKEILDNINNMNINSEEKSILISKIIIWDLAGGDF